VLGGGMPMAAFGGKKEIMDHIAPIGKVYQAGTLSGNPVSVAAGYATLKILNEDRGIYQRLEEKGLLLKEKISEVLNRKGIPYTINRMGSMFSVHFASHKVKDFKTAAATDTELFNRFFHHLLKLGIYLPPSAFETWFLSDALSEEDIFKTAKAIETF
jgi:glutamate-1-semialdehyde 2,1-aminomutase